MTAEEEEPITSVRCANIGRSESTVLRVEPERGQIGQDLVEGSSFADREEARDVFEEDERRLDFSEKSSNMGPEPARVVDSESGAGDAIALAGEPRSEEMNNATPGSAVKGGEIRPDRSRIQEAFFHALDQDRERIPLPFTVQN
jgi:hypothetical protein